MGITSATLIGFGATSIVIIVVPLIVTESVSRSEYFWYRIAWTEFLATLVWVYIGGFFSLIIPKNREIRGLGAILPALGIVVVLYSISSFILMMISAYLPQFNSLYMASQVYRLAGLVIIIVFLFFSWISGNVDAETIPNGIHAPTNLIISLQYLENTLLARQNDLISPEITNKVDNLKMSLQSLREKIQYSLPNAGKIYSNKMYIDFSKVVDKLCDDCSVLDTKTLDEETLEAIIRRISVLNGEVQSISQNLRK